MKFTWVEVREAYWQKTTSNNYFPNRFLKASMDVMDVLAV
jgi:hypothetical protein